MIISLVSITLQNILFVSIYALVACEICTDSTFQLQDLRENCESALATLDALRDHHKGVIGDRPSPSQELTRQALKYRKTLFQSTQRRLASLDARMTNIIELSFHIVTQGDSRLMQSENQSMKTIAVMTLIFMPLSTVAGM